MPRTLVNFVTVLNVAELEDLHEGVVCQSMQGYVAERFLILCKLVHRLDSYVNVLLIPQHVTSLV